MTPSEFIQEWNNDADTVGVHTSGSTGTPKPMQVEKARMMASAQMTCDFLGLRGGDTALLCLPCDYIAGKMMIVRSIERGMKLIEAEPSNHPLTHVNDHIHLAAMVPSQVYETLRCDSECRKLKEIDNVIIGGGAVTGEIEQELRGFPNAVWSTYGMTETLSHIAMRRLSGPEASRWYTLMDGVSVSLTDKEDGNIGRLVIDAPHLCDRQLVTNDIVELKDTTHFRIIGRTDNVICSGGIKLHIEELEEKLRPHLPCDFCISKRQDPKFGEVAVLLIAAGNISTGDIMATCRNTLDYYQLPKHIVTVTAIPMTGNGKIDRHLALALAK